MQSADGNLTEGLLKLPYTFEDYEHLIEHIAPLHAELQFIHPFLEGNGRTARLFADLIALKNGFDLFNFEKITEKRMAEYIGSVQTATGKNYELMFQRFRSLKK